VLVGGAIDRHGWTVGSFIVASAAIAGVVVAWRLRRVRTASL